MRHLAVLLAAFAFAGCRKANVAPLDKLPKSIGDEVHYNVGHGTEPQPWAQEVLKSAGLPVSFMAHGTQFAGLWAVSMATLLSGVAVNALRPVGRIGVLRENRRV